MTNETAVATREGKAPEPKAPVRAGGPIAGIIPQDIEQAFRLSQALAQSGDMIPQHYQGNPQKIMAAVMRGAEVGLAPMQALSSIAVINGRATLWGDSLPALVLRAGHFVDVEVKGEGKEAVATATLTRASGEKIVRSFSMADARQAGLADKKGPWQQYPKRMLSMRARSWAIRDGAPEVLMGLGVADEVIDHQGFENARDITPRSSRRGSISFATPEPDPEPDPIIETASEPSEPADSTPAGPDPERGAPMDQAWDEGSAAFKAGIAYEDNPHEPGQDANSWAGGWRFEEQRAAEAAA